MEEERTKQNKQIKNRKKATILEMRPRVRMIENEIQEQIAFFQVKKKKKRRLKRAEMIQFSDLEQLQKTRGH